MARMAGSQRGRAIPTQLSLAQFEAFVLPHLSRGSRGPAPKLGLHKIFNYILRLLYMGCQWKELPIEKDGEGRPEIHHTRIYSAFRRWDADGCMDAIFTGSVYDCRLNRKAISNRDMVPNISPNSRGRKPPKRGRKPQ